MNALSFRKFERGTPLPVVLLIDPQCASAAAASPGNTEATAPIAMCRLTLEFARRHGFPIAMTRWRGSGARFRGWLPGLEPRASEMVFDQPRASCYSSETFAEMMSAGGGGLNAVLACPLSAIAGSSTAAEACRRGHRITFLSDASVTSGPENASGGEELPVATRIRERCQLTTVEGWMASQLAAFRREIGGES